MNKIKDFLLNTLGTIGGILYYVILIVISVLPFAVINLPLWAEIIMILIVYFLPFLSPIIWIWGLISAIIGPQDWIAIVYYIVFAIFFMPIFIKTVLDIFTKK